MEQEQQLREMISARPRTLGELSHDMDIPMTTVKLLIDRLNDTGTHVSTFLQGGITVYHLRT